MPTKWMYFRKFFLPTHLFYLPGPDYAPDFIDLEHNDFGLKD